MAPNKVIVPSSTEGKSVSCCIAFKRCTSSTKSIVFLPDFENLSSAFTISVLSSLIPDKTAFNFCNLALVFKAIISTKVVLPTPGGPVIIVFPILSLRIALRRREFFPKIFL